MGAQENRGWEVYGRQEWKGWEVGVGEIVEISNTASNISPLKRL